MENERNKIKYLRANTEDGYSVMSILKLLNGDRNNFDLKKCVVAKCGNEIIGCVRVKVFADGTLELSSLAVLPEHQRVGIGSELVKHFLDAEKERPIFLLTSQDKESFYNKFDFHLLDPDELPTEFENEYLRIINLPFAKNIQVIVMKIE